MTEYDLKHPYFLSKHTDSILTKGAANIHLKNIAQLSQASYTLIFLSAGYSIGCIAVVFSEFCGFMYLSMYLCYLHNGGNVIASKAASRLCFN